MTFVFGGISPSDYFRRRMRWRNGFGPVCLMLLPWKKSLIAAYLSAVETITPSREFGRLLCAAGHICRSMISAVTAENPKIVTERSFYNIGNIRLDMESAQHVAHGKTRLCDTERMLADRGPVMMCLLKCLFHFAGVKNFPPITLQIPHDPLISCGASGVCDP